MNFEGKNVLIIGGSSGIGLSVVKQLQAQKAVVYLISRSSSEEWGADVHFLSADVTGEMGEVEAFLPPQLHGLVYSVGSINLKPFNRLTVDDFMTDMQLNLFGAVKVIQQALKQLKNAVGSSVVLVSSVAASTGMAYHASIAAAKGAVEGFALSLASELAPAKIRVNVVAPSLTDTPLAKNLLSTPEKREASEKRHPLGKIGKPEDISRAITFLLSEESEWMTGQVMHVDGGMGNLKML
ncbi:SDR family oxidoreductase [Mucilaginibacter achroorhodeus]|uniref:SDR family oxidoreductase n=1 Tax=Mucilaginibacter achroorhodeus TaxID=2599294 RepID=A0A563UA17_9SPHI|nr:SDR family oxidoreductase [Mucilaginibacter achroorhodeus]TWR28156.1 SDR family oxidoreductase [Mucilaginibacter achroorhodeus]